MDDVVDAVRCARRRWWRRNRPTRGGLTVAVLASAVVATVSVAAAAEEVYVWRDKSGEVRFSSVPDARDRAALNAGTEAAAPGSGGGPGGTGLERAVGSGAPE